MDATRLDYQKDWKALSLCTFFLFIKMLFVGFYTGYARSKEGTPAAPEDGKKSNGEHVALAGGTAHSNVERGLSMHRNDLENIPIFLIMAFMLEMISGASSKAYTTANIIYYVLFTAARFGHTIFYMLAVGPARSACWGLGVLVNLALGIHLLVVAFSLGK